MTVVAICRRCGYQKAFFEEAFSVNALAVVFYNVVLGYIIDFGDWSSFAVAFSAEIRDVKLID